MAEAGVDVLGGEENWCPNYDWHDLMKIMIAKRYDHPGRK